MHKLHFSKWFENTDNHGIECVHNTSLENAVQILQNGFSLKDFGQTAKNSGQTQWLKLDPFGVYFIRTDSIDPKFLPSHPWSSNKKGVRVYATVFLKNPLRIGGFVKLGDDIVDYKIYLRDQYKAGNGKVLTKKLMKLGYDGIITDGEIVVFDLSRIMIDRDRTIDEIRYFRDFLEKDVDTIDGIVK